MAQEFKLSGVSANDVAEGSKQEVEVEGIEEGKVLLTKAGGKLYATSTKCTHYGAPLKNGVLTPDGRLTCPWHGACFNVATGDVEDAPALDPLARYEVVEKGGSVYVKGDKAQIKENYKSAKYPCSASGQEKIVIVGGGSGATGVLMALREGGSTAPVTMISNEPYLPIDRTKLSKALATDASKLALHPQDWYDAAAISTVEDEVTAVDFSSKKVTTKSGKSYPYTKLVLATGGTAKKLPLPGFKDLNNIFVLRSIPDVKQIVEAVGEKKGKNVVIVGSSFIGMEVANALAKENSVSVIGMEKAPLERVMGEEVGRIFQTMVEKSGVKFYMEASVDKATPDSSNSKNVGAVHLKDGTELKADLVILGVGVAPATTFLKESKDVSLEKDGSLSCNENFEVNGLKDVYAIGDIASYPYHGPGGNGATTRIEHWNVAQNAGRNVGATLASSSSKSKPSPSSPKQFIPVFWSALGAQLRYCGNTPNGWDDLVLKGQPKEGKFAAYYAKGETVVAVATMQMDPIMSTSVELMRAGTMPSKSELQNGADVLKVMYG